MRRRVATRPRLAARRIFAEDALPLAQQGIIALRDKSVGASGQPLVGDAASSHAHSFFSKAWGTHLSGIPADAPYPFEPTPTCANDSAPADDTFRLLTLASASTARVELLHDA